MNSIYDFLGVSHPEDGHLDAEWHIHESNSEIKNMNPHSYRYLSEEDIEKIEKEAGEELMLHGYRRPAC